MGINKDTFIKILIPSLVFTSLISTIIPELRLMAVLFFILGSITWFLILIKKIEFLTKDDEIDRLLKFFIYPTSIFNVLILFLSKEYRESGNGWIYLILSIFTIMVYLTPQFRNAVTGINKKITKGVFWGVGIAFGFLIINKVLPGFSLLTPEIPFSIIQGVRFIIVVGIAPILEESLFRGFLLNSLQTTYHLSFTSSNLIQGGVLFPSYHFLAYQIFLTTLENIKQLIGATQAVLGALITAAVFGIISGYLVRRFKTMTVSITTHLFINLIIFTSLAVGSLFAFG